MIFATGVKAKNTVIAASTPKNSQISHSRKEEELGHE